MAHPLTEDRCWPGIIAKWSMNDERLFWSDKAFAQADKLNAEAVYTLNVPAGDFVSADLDAVKSHLMQATVRAQLTVKGKPTDVLITVSKGLTIVGGGWGNYWRVLSVELAPVASVKAAA